MMENIRKKPSACWREKVKLTNSVPYCERWSHGSQSPDRFRSKYMIFHTLFDLTLFQRSVASLCGFRLRNAPREAVIYRVAFKLFTLTQRCFNTVDNQMKLSSVQFSHVQLLSTVDLPHSVNTRVTSPSESSATQYNYSQREMEKFW